MLFLVDSLYLTDFRLILCAIRIMSSRELQGVLRSAVCVHHKLSEIFRKVLSELNFF